MNSDIVRIQIGGDDPHVEINGRRLNGVKSVSVTPSNPHPECSTCHAVTVTFDVINDRFPDVQIDDWGAGGAETP